MSEHSSAVLILAAGASTRMGSPKQLLAWGGHNLLQNAITQARASIADAVLVVLGAHVTAVQKAIPSHVQWVENPEWETGMGSSIACGVRFLLQSKTTYGTILIMLGDQPLVDSDYINQMMLVSKKEDKGIIATAYDAKAGVPAVFSAPYFKELVQLHAEFGAKALLAKSSGDIYLIQAGDKTADIDTKEDYEKLNKLNH